MWNRAVSVHTHREREREREREGGGGEGRREGERERESERVLDMIQSGIVQHHTVQCMRLIQAVWTHYQDSRWKCINTNNEAQPRAHGGNAFYYLAESRDAESRDAVASV